MSLNNTNNMDMLHAFRKYLQKNDLRTTPERMTIASEVFHSHTHFNAENLYVLLQNKNRKISRATVYRTLDLLVDSGLVRKAVFDNHIASFEKYFNNRDHGHFICTQCGKIIEFYDQKLQALHRKLEQKLAVKIVNHTHHVYGKCKDCIS